jgi:hypothetical protein
VNLISKASEYEIVVMPDSDEKRFMEFRLGSNANVGCKDHVAFFHLLAEW